MTTGQKYVDGPDSAQTSLSAAENTLLAVNSSPLPIAPAFERPDESNQLDRLYYDDHISYDDRPWAKILPVTTDAMRPQFGIGGYVVGILLDPSEYAQTTGPVAIRYRNDSQPPVMGRVSMGNKRSVCLSADRPGYESVRIARKEVGQVYRIVYAFGHPVL